VEIMMAERQGKSIRRQRSQWLLLTASAILLFGIGFIVWRTFLYQSDVIKGTAALAEAYSNQRPLEARISGLPYAPVSRVRGDQELINKISLERAERILLDALFEHPNSASHYALGKFYLTQQQYDEAISQFEEALKTDPKNAQIHSDYGAALLEKGKIIPPLGESGNCIVEFAKSLEHLNTALSLDKSFSEALFNRAILYQEMMLPYQAEESWQKYLETDSISQWADEAREELEQLQQQKQKFSQDKNQLFQNFLDAYKNKDEEKVWNLISQYRDISGSFVENRLLDEYLDLAIKGQTEEAENRLQILLYAGALETARADDFYISNLITFYKSASTAKKKDLVEARGCVKQGHENLYRFNTEESLKQYKRAAEIFVRTGSLGEAIYINYPLGHSYLLEHKAELALSIFQKLADTCEANRYRWLLAQSLNAIGNAHTSLRDFSLAINSTNRSLKLSEEIGDISGVIKTLNQLGGHYFSLNNYDRCLALYAQSLAMDRIYSPSAMQLWRDYFSISQALNHIGLYAAAIDYQKEALHIALQGELPQMQCRSYSYLGVLYGNGQNYGEAIKSIQLALDLSKSFSDKGAHQETTAYSFLQLGNIYKQAGDFNKALENYDQAIQFYDGLESKYFNYVSRKGKLLCCIAQGGCPYIDQEIETTLKLFEEHRAKIQEESNRGIYYDGEQNIYDIAVGFEYLIKKDSRKAFEYSEACRARSLRDLSGGDINLNNDSNNPDLLFNKVSEPMNLDQIQNNLRENTQILQYAVLNNNLLIWMVSKGEDLHSESIKISLDNLNEKVRNYIRLVSKPYENNPEETSREARSLYEILIKPVESAIDKNKRLCIIPDKILNYLPFAGLISSDSGKYFIQEHNFILAPSSSIFVTCSEAAREKSEQTREHIVTVGNPLFDKAAFLLDDLKSAAREAETIAGYYDSHLIIKDSQATEARVRNEMEKADVIHLALHAVVNESSPLRSKLILAKEKSQSNSSNELDGTLLSYEIYKLNLSQARLVVLSACQTGVEKYYGGEGMIGISRPFIAKRVPLVVASLWRIDSDSTAELMINFHKHRRTDKNISTSEALRRAQLDMLESSIEKRRLPYHWAAFVAIGGYTEF
jgi:CHAT domain-containing protein/tetratricopeptide (TPR) repeat protein